MAQMKYLIFILLLSACGKECQQIVTALPPLSVGIYEKISCDGGYVKSVTPKYLPGTDKITHLLVDCVRVERVCK